MTKYITAFLALTALTLGNTPTARTPEEETEYTKKIMERSESIVQELKVAAKAAPEIKTALIEQYRALDLWQRTNEASVKTLKKETSNTDKEAAAKASSKLKELYGERKKLHDAFLFRITPLLTVEQVEMVKDLMTYNKVAVTFRAYCAQYPMLTEPQKAKIVEWLKEAREEAMDGGSSDEKSEIFNKYKGRINNFLSKEGLTKPKAK